MNEPSSGCNQVDVLAEEFLERYRRGERPTVAEYAARHPELAGEIHEVFPALLLVEEAGPGRGASGAGGKPSWTGADRAPERLGDFRIVREVGRGGMGVVYEAVQESLGRRVALKVLSRGLLDGPSALKRFRREAHLIAGLHHSNIVQVFGVGEDEGHHYYAMQFIRGRTLEAVLEDVRRLRGGGCDASPGGPPTDAETGAALVHLTGRSAAGTIDAGEYGRPGMITTEAGAPSGGRHPALGETSLVVVGGDRSSYYDRVARVGLQVAEALVYAHDQGVLHRDVKPSNLLIDEQGTVWVVDFGLAKPDGGDKLSATRDVVGTLRYMAPERFDGRSDRGGDVYSLGATLYELLTLSPAFADADQARLVREILESTPPPPRAIDRRIPRDLETIVLKAMAKEPSDRYATAAALAEDLRRFLEDRTILARRSTSIERSWRWCRRNPAVAALLVSVAVLLTFTAASASVAAARYKGQFERAREAESLGREKLFAAYLAEARASRYGRRPGQRFDSLRSLEEAAKIRRAPELRDEAVACLALPDLAEVFRFPRPFDGCRLAFDPTLERYARLDWNGVVSVRRVADDGEIRRFPSPGPIAGECFVLAFSPDGRRLAVDYALANVRKLTVWSLDRDEPCLVEEDSRLYGVRFSPVGNPVAIRREKGPITLVDLESGAVEARWDVGGVVCDFAFSPDGRRMAVCFYSSDLKLQIREAPSGAIVREIACPGECSVDWSRDGKTLAVGSSSALRAELYDVGTGRRIGAISDKMGLGLSVKFQPGAGLLTTQSWRGKLQFWRPHTGEQLLSLPADDVIDFRADGLRVGLIVAGRRPAILQIADGRELRTLVREPARRREWVSAADLHPGGRLLAVAMTDGVGLWDVDRDVAVASLPIGHTVTAVFGPTGELLTAGQSGVIQWPVGWDEGDPGLVRIGPPKWIEDFPSGRVIALSPDGRLLAADRPGGATIVDRTGASQPIQLGPQSDVRSLAISPDGQWAATGSHFGDEGVKVWSIADGRLVNETASPGGIARPLFSPDGRWLVVNQNRSNACRLLSVGDWREVRRSSGTVLRFFPDGRLLVLNRGNGLVALIETETGRVVANLEDPNQPSFTGAIFSRDGARLYLPIGDDERVASVWDLRLVRRQLVAMDLDWDWPALPEPVALATPPAQLRVVADLGPHDFSHLPYSQAEIERLDAALQIVPDDWYTLLRRAWIFTRCGRDADAVADLTRALEIRPGDDRALTTRAEAFLHEGQYESCLSDYEAALPGAPNPAAAHDNLARIYATAPPPARDPSKALPHALRAIELAPKLASYHNIYGIVLARLDRYRESAAELETSLAGAAREEQAVDLFFLAIDHHRLGEADRAKAEFARAAGLEAESTLPPREREGLRAFHAEAEAVLSTPRR